MSSKVKTVSLVILGVVLGIFISFQYSAFAQKSRSNNLPLAKLNEFAEVFGIIKSDYVENVTDEKLIDEAITGMVSSLDPHSAYLDKEAFKELQEGTQGHFVGIGIEIGTEDGYIKVVSPIEDSPAYRAGIKAGDLITRIDNVAVRSLSMDNAIKKIRGEPKTKVNLTISRTGEAKPINISLLRDIIKQHSVKAKLVEPGYAWIRIAQFQDPTVDDLAEKIQALYEQDPALKGIVLDLRNDPGGVLPGAIGVSAAFLPKDSLVVSTNGQIEDAKQKYFAKPIDYADNPKQDPLAQLPAAIKEVPLVVLINTGSASASEIVAGALQDYKRATIIGTQSFGKGSVQTVRRISETTAIKITTARYYTPLGRAIQAKGITPDLLVEETANGDGLNRLRSREADLEKHLNNDKDKEVISANPDAIDDEEKLLAIAKNSKVIEYGTKDDFQLQQALNHLKGLPVKVAHTDNARNVGIAGNAGNAGNHATSKKK